LEEGGFELALREMGTPERARAGGSDLSGKIADENGPLGITEVPTLCLDHLTPTQARAFMIADNRPAEIAIWDDRLLAEQLKELALV
jgi:hypothetical protein